MLLAENDILYKDGAVAQLGERRVRNAKVGSSNLLRSTKLTHVAVIASNLVTDWEYQTINIYCVCFLIIKRYLWYCHLISKP